VVYAEVAKIAIAAYAPHLSRSGRQTQVAQTSTKPGGLHPRPGTPPTYDGLGYDHFETQFHAPTIAADHTALSAPSHPSPASTS
jgi:hypothetical protein